MLRRLRRDEARVSVRLIDAVAREEVRRETLTAPREEVYDIGERIGKRIVRAIPNESEADTTRYRHALVRAGFRDTTGPEV